MMALRSDASLQGPGRQQLAEQPSISASKSAEFEKAMFDCNLLDRRGRAAHQQRGVHVAESLAAKEGDRRHANYAQEGAVQRAQQAQGELERTQQLENRIRLLPSLRAISEMETAIVWPAEYLGRRPDLLRAVNAVAFAHSLDRDSGWVAAKRGGYGDTWRQRHDAGCAIIAQGLRGCRVPVF
jgi:hypothetical protein